MAVKNGSVIDAETAELVHAEYVAGKKSIRELAEKYDLPFLALKQRAVYGKWSLQRGQGMLKTQMLKGARKFTLSKDSLKSKSDSFVDRMQQNCEETLDIIETIKIPNQWDKLALREQVMSALQRRGWAAFGLDTVGNTNITLHVQSELSPGSDQPKRLTQGEIVDVETVPEPKPVESDNQYPKPVSDPSPTG